MKVASNSPLQIPPPDYCPKGSDNWFKIEDGYDAGKTQFYFDARNQAAESSGSVDYTVLLVHGNPESSYTYRHVRDALLASDVPLRVVAPDHIGMGISDQADFEMVDMHHAANLQGLVRHLDLQRVVLVIHDWGGPIGVGALIEDPERVIGLAVMNTTVFPMPAEGYTYKNYPYPVLPWFATASLIPDKLWGGVAAAVVSHAHPQSMLSFMGMISEWLWKHARDQIEPGTPEYVWSRSYSTPANARSSKRNVRQTPFWGHGYRYQDDKHGVQDNHAYYERIQQNISKCWGPDGRNIPACGYFGQWDACGKDPVIAQWHEALPAMKNRTYRFPDIGHFIEESKGPEIAASILEMMAAD